MVLIPATLSLGVQVTAAIFCLVTALSVIVNSFVKPDLGALHCVLALGAIIGMRNGYCNEPRKRRRHHGCHCGFS